MGNVIARSGLELKLAGVRSTAINSQITAAQRNGSGYEISIVPQPQEKFSPAEILAMNFYGFLQRASLAAGDLRRFERCLADGQADREVI